MNPANPRHILDILRTYRRRLVLLVFLVGFNAVGAVYLGLDRNWIVATVGGVAAVFVGILAWRLEQIIVEIEDALDPRRNGQL